MSALTINIQRSCRGLFTQVLALLMAASSPALCQTEVSGNVDGVWRLEESPYLAVDSIFGLDGETLIIEAGVAVLFEAQVPFTIQGLLEARGDRGRLGLYHLLR